MSHLNDSDSDLHRFRKRIMALAVFVLFCFFLLLLRFVWLQIVRHSNYAAQADENRISIVPTMPARGMITDRNGVVLADNYSAYTLEITPAKIQGKVDDIMYRWFCTRPPPDSSVPPVTGSATKDGSSQLSSRFTA